MTDDQKRSKEQLTDDGPFEIIDAKELAARWKVPETWIRDQVRSRTTDPIPCVRLGKYVRFEWGSPQLDRWWARRRSRRAA
jgi:hypothetical protein